MQKNSSILVNKNTITSIAIGGFDGMHIAHQELFKNLDTNGAIVCIETGYANLTPKKHRQEYTKYPIYYYLLENIKHLSGEEFIKLLKQEFPKLKKIVVGFDFHFGKNRQYNTSNIQTIFNKDIKIIDEVSINNIPIHSRQIREYLLEGNIELANKLLGKEYKIEGIHIIGQGLGAKNFVPTINLKVDDFLLPKAGVYITKTILDEKEYNSVTFLGHRVTTDGSFAVETHMVEDLIQNKNKNIQVKFLKNIRDNQKFSNFEDLKNQIFEDIKIAKEFFISN